MAWCRGASHDSPERLRRNPVKTLERLELVEDNFDAVRLEVRMPRTSVLPARPVFVACVCMASFSTP